MLRVFVHAPKARRAVKATCHAIADKMTVRRFTVSAMIPAGSAKRSKGVEVAVAISESEKLAPRSCSNQVAITSWAARTVADRTVANQILVNVGFLSANHVEVECIRIFARKLATIPAEQLSSRGNFQADRLAGTARHGISPAHEHSIYCRVSRCSRSKRSARERTNVEFLSPTCELPSGRSFSIQAEERGQPFTRSGGLRDEQHGRFAYGESTTLTQSSLKIW